MAEPRPAARTPRQSGNPDARKRLYGAVRAACARLGGDEFGVILSPLENAEGISPVVARIAAEMQSPFVFEDEAYLLQASIGSALMPEDGYEPERLLDVADRRMYAVKQSHKNK